MPGEVNWVSICIARPVCIAVGRKSRPRQGTLPLDCGQRCGQSSAHTWIVGELPLVEVTDCRDDEVKVLSLCDTCLQILVLKAPLCLLRLPFGLEHLDFEPNVVVDIVSFRNSLPVRKDLRALCVLFTPLAVGSETGLVNVRRYVATYAWISILKPCTTLRSVRKGLRVTNRV